MKSKKTNLDFTYEQPFIEKGIYVAGVDEAGRGPVAGPVVASAVILKTEFVNDYGITDSKKLTYQKREELYGIIKQNSVSIGISIIDNFIIDEINILQSTIKAMHQAIKQLKPIPTLLFIDGNYFKDVGIPFKTIVKGDSKCLSIAAASIIAKVTRDKWMIEVADKLYPQYNFRQHKGYGTKAHIEAIKEHGLCEFHRKTFLKKYCKEDNNLFNDMNK
ncbi:MAG: ribonuclease HII [bacterium]